MDASKDVKPGTIRLVDGTYRIAKVGIKTVVPDEYKTVIKWYLPKTRADKFAIIHFQKSEEAVHDQD